MDDAGAVGVPPRVPEDEGGEVASMMLARVMPVDTHLDVAALATVVQQHLDDACAAADAYLWDREPPLVQGEAGAVHVTMRVQDCVDDEWFLTYLLRELTRVHDVAVSVSDEDGEFLLIEAADALPSWTAPDVVANRVWIYRGALHLIPPDVVPLDETATLTAADAVRHIAEGGGATLAPPDVAALAFQRVDTYPDAVRTHHHTTLACLPLSAAKVLAAVPGSVAGAVHALATRDVVSARAALRLTYFGVHGVDDSDTRALPAPDVQLVRVRLTRHLYAQLSMDRYFPPRALGQRWQRIVESYRADLQRTDKTLSEHDTAWGRWCDLGTKLLAGLEMWMHGLEAATRHAPAQGDAGAPPAYEAFLASLTKLGYFGGEVRGSARWQSLERQARATAAQLPRPGAPVRDATLPTLQRVQEVIRAPATDAVYTLLPTADIAALQAHEDSDAWLSLAPEELEAKLARYGPPDTDEAAMGQFQDFMSKMQSFLEAEGDVEGALFEDEQWDDGEEADADVADDGDGDDDEAEERARRMAALVEGVPAHEWGAANAAKPAQPEAVGERPRAARADAVGELEAAPPAAATTRLSGLAPVRPLDGDSDSDHESLASDGEDAPDERRERYRALDMDDMPPAPEPADDGDMPMSAELDDFLEFTRRALGLSESQYAQILEERRQRGGTLRGFTQRLCLPTRSRGPSMQPRRRRRTLTRRVPTLHGRSRLRRMAPPRAPRLLPRPLPRPLRRPLRRRPAVGPRAPRRCRSWLISTLRWTRWRKNSRRDVRHRLWMSTSLRRRTTSPTWTTRRPSYCSTCWRPAARCPTRCASLLTSTISPTLTSMRLARSLRASRRRAGALAP